ncbi:MAG: hypothetical protein ACKVX7_07960 [Planctomycetota bacterium]
MKIRRARGRALAFLLRVSLASVALATLAAAGGDEFETRTYNLRRTVATSSADDASPFGFARTGSAITRYLSVEAVFSIVLSRAFVHDSRARKSTATCEDGWLICRAPAARLQIVEATLRNLQRAGTRELKFECVFVPHELREHPALADPSDTKIRELLAAPAVVWLSGSGPRDQPLVLAREREISFVADYLVNQSTPTPMMVPAITSDLFGLRVKISAYPIASDPLVTLDISCRRSAVVTSETPVGDDYGPLDLPTVDEALIATRVRVPYERYVVIGHVAGNVGGTLVVRVSTAPSERFADLFPWRIYDLTPLTRGSPHSQVPLVLPHYGEDEWDSHRHVSIVDRIATNDSDPLEESQTVTILAALGLTGDPMVAHAADAKLTLVGDPSRFATIEQKLIEVHERQLPSLRLEVYTIAAPRAALTALFDTDTNSSQLVSTWREVLARYQGVVIEENFLAGVGGAPLALASVRKQAHIERAQCVSGGRQDGRVVEVHDPVIRDVYEGIDLAASVLVDALRPSTVELRLEGVVCASLPMRPRTIHFPTHKNVETNGVVHRTRVLKKLNITLPDVSVTSLDFCQAIPRNQFVVIDTSATGDTARLVVVRIQ